MSDHRPANCRFRLRDEGKAYPRSACKACGRTVMTGLGTSCQNRPASHASREMNVSIMTMRMSGNREEYYVRITCDGRTHDVSKYGQHYLNRAKYERDALRHLLLGEPKPDLMSPEYADKEPAPGAQPEPDPVKAAAQTLYDAFPTAQHLPEPARTLFREGKPFTALRSLSDGKGS